MKKIKFHLLFIALILSAFYFDPVGLGMMTRLMIDPLALVPTFIMSTRVLDFKKFSLWSLFLIIPLVILSTFIQYHASGEVLDSDRIIYKALSLYFLFSLFNMSYLLYKQK